MASKGRRHLPSLSSSLRQASLHLRKTHSPRSYNPITQVRMSTIASFKVPSVTNEPNVSSCSRVTLPHVNPITAPLCQRFQSAGRSVGCRGSLEETRPAGSANSRRGERGMSRSPQSRMGQILRQGFLHRSKRRQSENRSTRLVTVPLSPTTPSQARRMSTRPSKQLLRPRPSGHPFRSPTGRPSS